MKNLLLGISILVSTSCLAFTKPCVKNKAEEAAVAIEKVNEYNFVSAQLTSSFFKKGLTVASVETYTGIGGAVYIVTLDGCKVINTEMSEEIDRYQLPRNFAGDNKTL